jgi:hypothetical protein
VPLANQAKLTGWATPQHCDGRGATGPASKNKELGRDVLSFAAETIRHGASQVLNPAFSRWLMGFPEAFDRCSPGWQAWDTAQQKLAECSGNLEVFLRLLLEIASDG